jgi:hypothetical protein
VVSPEQISRVSSWNTFDPVPLKAVGDSSIAFIHAGIPDYRSAAEFVSRLPYGRNTVTDPLVVLIEGRGTCSTKHALLYRLAVELKLDMRSWSESTR